MLPRLRWQRVHLTDKRGCCWWVLHAFLRRILFPAHSCQPFGDKNNQNTHLLYFGAERDNPFHFNFSLIFLQRNHEYPAALGLRFLISRGVFLFMIRYLVFSYIAVSDRINWTPKESTVLSLTVFFQFPQSAAL